MHDLPLIATIAVSFTAAWLLGLLTQRFGLSPIVGYLLAGVVIGPYTPGFIGDIGLAHQLAEIGVILLMFGVGLHFRLKDLLAVQAVAIPGAIFRSVVATLAGLGAYMLLGLPAGPSAVIAMAMAVASTVVLMRVLMDADQLGSPAGHVAVGWLLVEDVLTVVVLVLIPVLGSPVGPGHGAHDPPAAVAGAVPGSGPTAGPSAQAPLAPEGSGAGGEGRSPDVGSEGSVRPRSADPPENAPRPASGHLSPSGEKGSEADAGTAPVLGVALGLGWALLKLATLVAVLWVIGGRIIPWVLVQVARLRSRELFTLTVLVFSIAVAAASYFVFGASMALGAFLAGMVVAQSPVSHQVAADALPMRDAFAVIFFVSVGMVFNPTILIESPAMVAVAMGIILVVKPLATLFIVAVLGHSVRTGLTVALASAQIGEFSFILANLARGHGLMPEDGYNTLVGAAILSIIVNPLLFRSLPAIERQLRRLPWLWSLLNARAERQLARINRNTTTEIGHRVEAGERLAILVGYGPVGRSVHRLLREAGMTVVVIDLNMDSVIELNLQGLPAIFGDASHESILEQAGMKEASHLVLTLPHAPVRHAIVTAARGLSPKARILVRAHYLSEQKGLEHAGATAAVFEEAEVAVALARLVLANTGAGRDLVEQKLRDLRLQLFLENMSNIRTQHVRSIMVPWKQVRRLTTAMDRARVLGEVGQHHFSRWPVLDGRTQQVAGYLLTKDLLAEGAADGDWAHLVRPVQAVRSDQDVETTLLMMQRESATVCLVTDDGVPQGLVTLEDILEQVVGRIEDEYAHERETSVREAVTAGGVILALRATARDEAIREMVAAVPALPAEVADLVIAREEDLSTDLGMGVALPHARAKAVGASTIVVARSAEGVRFSSPSDARAHLIFLLVTPPDQPDQHLTLLGQLARLAQDEPTRTAIRDARTADDVLAALPRE